MFWLAWLAVVCCRSRGACEGKGQSTFSGNAAENEIITMQGTSPLPFPSGWLLSFSHFTSISSHFDLSSLLFFSSSSLCCCLLVSLLSLSYPLFIFLSLSICVCMCVSISRSPVTNRGDGCQGRCAACLPKIIPLNSGI